MTYGSYRFWYSVLRKTYAMHHHGHSQNSSVILYMYTHRKILADVQLMFVLMFKSILFSNQTPRNKYCSSLMYRILCFYFMRFIVINSIKVCTQSNIFIDRLQKYVLILFKKYVNNFLFNLYVGHSGIHLKTVHKCS